MKKTLCLITLAIGLFGACSDNSSTVMINAPSTSSSSSDSNTKNSSSYLSSSSSSSVESNSSSSSESKVDLYPLGEPMGGTFNDSRDDKVYGYVKIGEQVWMSENLNYSDNFTDHSTCYENSETYCDFYGRLYDFTGAVIGNPIFVDGFIPGTCPAGWHLPSDDEWSQLAIYINSVTAEGSIGYSNGSKEMDDWHSLGTFFMATDHWDNVTGTDDFGFGALPSGGMNENGLFHGEGTQAFWWSANEDDDHSEQVWNRYLGESMIFDRNSYLKSSYKSVRCIANSSNDLTFKKLEDSESKTNNLIGLTKDMRDGKVYSTITIDSQKWFSENLNYEASSDSYCLDNIEEYCDQYGRLYGWSAIETLEGLNSSICPSGWKVPSLNDWETLANYLSENDPKSEILENHWTEIGRLMKAESWNGTNQSGFNVIPSGYISYTGTHVSGQAHWWSSTVTTSIAEYVRINNEDLEKVKGTIDGIRSIRCVEE